MRSGEHRCIRPLVRLLLVLGTLAAFLAPFGLWLDHQALSGPGWQRTSPRLLADRQVKLALGRFAVDELFAREHVDSVLNSLLPGSLAVSTDRRLRGLGRSLALRILSTTGARDVWQTANREAHGELLALLSSRRRPPSEVSLDLTPLFAQLVRELNDSAPVRAATALGAPQLTVGGVDAGRLPVLHGDQVRTARPVVNAVHGLGVPLAVAAAILLALAVSLSPGRRAAVLRRAGLGLLLAGVAAVVVRAVGGPALANALATPPYQPATRSAWRIATTQLSTAGIVVAACGAAALLAGALSARREACAGTA